MRLRRFLSLRDMRMSCLRILVERWLAQTHAAPVRISRFGDAGLGGRAAIERRLHPLQPLQRPAAGRLRVGEDIRIDRGPFPGRSIRDRVNLRVGRAVAHLEIVRIEFQPISITTRAGQLYRRRIGIPCSV